MATSEVRRDPGRGLSFAELGTRSTRWRLRRWRMFGPRLGPPKGSRCRGGGVPLQQTGGQRAGPAGLGLRAGALLARCCRAELGPSWGARRFCCLYLATARSRPSWRKAGGEGPAAGGAAGATSTTRLSSTGPPFPLPFSPPSCCRKCLPVSQSKNWERPWRSCLPPPHPVFFFPSLYPCLLLVQSVPRPSKVKRW